jgi:hypothetical protein
MIADVAESESAAIGDVINSLPTEALPPNLSPSEMHLEEVTLSYINDNYYDHTDNEMKPTDLAWSPQHRLSFEKSTTEMRQQYANTQKDIVYDIDAFKAFIEMGSLSRGVKLPMQLFSRLSTGFITHEKKARMLVKTRGSSYTSVPVGEVTNIQIGKFTIPYLGETGIYLVFPNLYVPSSGKVKTRISQTDAIALEDHVISAVKLDCDRQHLGCNRSQISDAVISSVTAQFLFSREARESVPVNARATKQLPEIFLGCFENCLQTSLMHTRYAHALFYLNVYGNKSFNVVGTQKELEVRIDSILQVLKRDSFLSMDIDFAATRYESCRQTGLFVCATPDSYRKHDVSSSKGSSYPLIMINDLGGYHANHNTQKGQSILSRRGAIRHSNYYCTAIHHLNMDKRAMFHNVHVSSNYAIRPISGILQLYYSSKLYQHYNFFCTV